MDYSIITFSIPNKEFRFKLSIEVSVGQTDLRTKRYAAKLS
jgi:hypothetical protein